MIKIPNLKGTDIRAISSVNAHVRSQVEVERESFSAALKCALERFFSRVNQLVALQLAALDESLSTFGANMYPGGEIGVIY